MYALTRTGMRQLLLTEAPSLASSLVIAELFYKFRSFTLECIAFLATWYLLSAVLSRIFGSTERSATLRHRLR
jgi:hypothetical protein